MPQKCAFSELKQAEDLEERPERNNNLSFIHGKGKSGFLFLVVGEGTARCVGNCDSQSLTKNTHRESTVAEETLDYCGWASIRSLLWRLRGVQGRLSIEAEGNILTHMVSVSSLMSVEQSLNYYAPVSSEWGHVGQTEQLRAQCNSVCGPRILKAAACCVISQYSLQSATRNSPSASP